LQDDIEKYEGIQKTLDSKAKFRANIFFNTCFMLLLTQFGISYYAIYEVDWIGWDLVEPLTYTVA
jgi:hypothetical protein